MLILKDSKLAFRKRENSHIGGKGNEHIFLYTEKVFYSQLCLAKSDKRLDSAKQSVQYNPVGFYVFKRFQQYNIFQFSYPWEMHFEGGSARFVKGVVFIYLFFPYWSH